jgi:hypothetical protein
VFYAYWILNIVNKLILFAFLWSVSLKPKARWF